MVVLGVVLVLVALAVGILLVAGVASLEGTVDVSVPGGTLSLPPLTFLVTGMVVISVFWLGWVVLRTGVRHGRRRRAEAKEAAKEAEAKRVADEQRLKEEFAARERQLIEERRRHDAETAELKRGADPGATTDAPERGSSGDDPGAVARDTRPTAAPPAEPTPEADPGRADDGGPTTGGADGDEPPGTTRGQDVDRSAPHEDPQQDTGHGPRT